MNNMDMLLDLIIPEPFPSEEFNIIANGKPPIKFMGTKLLEKSFTEDEGGEFITFIGYFTTSNNILITKYQIYPGEHDEYGNAREYIKYRVLHTYHNVWTFYKGCVEDGRYHSFLRELSMVLTKTPSHFWLPLAEELPNDNH